jgi:hypothetical protein
MTPSRPGGACRSGRSARPAGRGRSHRGLGKPGERRKRQCRLARRRHRPGPRCATCTASTDGGDSRLVVAGPAACASSGSGQIAIPAWPCRPCARLLHALGGETRSAGSSELDAENGRAVLTLENGEVLRPDQVVLAAGVGIGRAAAGAGPCRPGDRRARLSHRGGCRGLGRLAAGGVRGPLDDRHPVRRSPAGRQLRRVRPPRHPARSAQMGAAA